MIDGATAALLDAIDGQRSVRSVTQILRAVNIRDLGSDSRIKQSIEQFFIAGIIGLDNQETQYKSVIKYIFLVIF